MSLVRPLLERGLGRCGLQLMSRITDLGYSVVYLRRGGNAGGLKYQAEAGVKCGEISFRCDGLAGWGRGNVLRLCIES